MSFQRITMIAVFFILELTRLWALNSRRRLPLIWGNDWFFNLKVGPDFYKGPGADLLRRYQKQSAIPFIVEMLLLAPVFLFAPYIYTLLATVATSVMLVFWNKAIGKRFLNAAKPFTISQPEASTVPIALSLTRRRLAEYTNLVVECSIVVLTAAGLGIFSHYWWFFNWDGNHTLSALLPIILYFYLQAGGLMLKQSFVRWRMTLPSEQTEQYLKVFEERRLIMIKLLDYMRIICAVMLPYYLFDQIAGDLLHWPHARLFHLVVGFSIMGALLIVLRWYIREVKKVVSQINFSDLVKMQRRLPDRPTSFGGYAYFDADNPSAVIRTTGGLVLNFANKRVYLYGGYLIGLVALVAVLHFY